MSVDNKKTQIFELLSTLDALKHLKRTGWIHFDVPQPETVSGHMYRMAILAMTLSGEDSSLDAMRCVKMALVHDIGEAIVGDITPRCGVSEAEKFKLEEDAVLRIASFVPATLGNEWEALWREYEAAETPEAKAVKQLDKFDMIAQAFSYEQKYGLDLSEFFNSTTNAFSTEPFISWNNELRERRTNWSSDNKKE
uniref:5'-deoxynucleotidase HDDC2 n=1 Tax=Panagrolaimus superbus TaxID=310955 RepID=A0A914Z5L8_9BILA